MHLILSLSGSPLSKVGLHRTQSFTFPTNSGSMFGVKSLVRHSSLDQICTVASQERQRLYYETTTTTNLSGKMQI